MAMVRRRKRKRRRGDVVVGFMIDPQVR